MHAGCSSAHSCRGFVCDDAQGQMLSPRVIKKEGTREYMRRNCKYHRGVLYLRVSGQSDQPPDKRPRLSCPRLFLEQYGAHILLCGTEYRRKRSEKNMYIAPPKLSRFPRDADWPTVTVSTQHLSDGGSTPSAAAQFHIFRKKHPGPASGVHS